MCECKVCKVTKVRVQGGKRSGCSGTYKVDGAGRRWNGLTCPDCRADYVGVRKGETREDLGPSKPLYTAKQRPCKDCGKMSANYTRCPPCLTLYMSNNDGLFYGGLDEGMFKLDTGNTRTSGLKAGFHY